MTHRVFSRNASSSRAIPTKKLASTEIVLPLRWGKNQPGMQASLENLSPEDAVKAEAIWRRMAQTCLEGVQELTDLGLHKQWANRPLEWFTNIDVVLTSSEWNNFFQLRDHKDAFPEIEALAKEMKRQLSLSSPRQLAPNEWHLPYLTTEERAQYKAESELAEDPLNKWEAGLKWAKLSTARCARVSYLKHDNTNPVFEEDMALFKRLVGSIPIHASPTEHQAWVEDIHAVSTPGDSFSSKKLDQYLAELRTSNFDHPWVQHRKYVECKMEYSNTTISEI